MPARRRPVYRVDITNGDAVIRCSVEDADALFENAIEGAGASVAHPGAVDYANREIEGYRRAGEATREWLLEEFAAGRRPIFELLCPDCRHTLRQPELDNGVCPGCGYALPETSARFLQPDSQPISKAASIRPGSLTAREREPGEAE